MGLFETVRAANGRPFRLEAHLRRLREGAATLGMGLPWSDEELAAALAATLVANGITEGVARLTVTSGNAFGAPASPVQVSGSILIHVRGTGVPEEAYARGYRAILSGVRRHSGDPLTRV